MSSRMVEGTSITPLRTSSKILTWPWTNHSRGYLSVGRIVSIVLLGRIFSDSSRQIARNVRARGPRGCHSMLQGLDHHHFAPAKEGSWSVRHGQRIGDGKYERWKYQEYDPRTEACRIDLRRMHSLEGTLSVPRSSPRAFTDMLRTCRRR